MVHLKVQALNEEAVDLYSSHGQYHKGDSGLDLFVIEDQEIKAGETTLVKLGIKAAAWNADGLKNCSWLLMARSSIYKTPLRLSNSVGLIDAGYRGEVMACVDNIKSEDFILKKGDRIVQAVAFSGEPITFELVDSLDETARGAGGFGSTSNDEDPSIVLPEAKKAKMMEEEVETEAIGGSCST